MTLDQIQLFEIIAKNGSLAKAARIMGRTPSALSMNLKNFENQYNLKLFDRSGYRLRLTLEGESVLGRARAVLDSMDTLDKHLVALAGGMEATLRVVVNNLFPIRKIEKLLVEFKKRFESVRFDLTVEGMERPLKLLQDGSVDLAISMLDPKLSSFEKKEIHKMKLIGVGSPDLVGTGKITKSELGTKTQIIVGSYREREDEKVSGVQKGIHKWTVGDFSTKYRFLKMGLGYGFMPDYWVEDDLRAKRLREIKAMKRVDTPMYLFRREDDPMGPAKSFFWEGCKPQ